MNVDQKLGACIKTRSLAAESFAVALKTSLADKNPVSEVLLRDRWHEQLRLHTEIFPDGWYVPPPHGMAVLLATDTDNRRINYTSLRPPEYWPQNEVMLDRKSGIIYAFASPVHRETGIIGDFGMTVYLGNKPGIIKHIQDCLRMNQEIFKYVTVGMPFREVSQYANNLFEQNNFSNDVTSVTDPAGINIGHTVPGSYEDCSKAEHWQQALLRISKKRVFVNLKENFKVRPGMAFTLEPRLTVVGDRKIPMTSFHTIVVVYDNGSKELLTNFSDVFLLSGMQYMEEIV